MSHLIQNLAPFFKCSITISYQTSRMLDVFLNVTGKVVYIYTPEVPLKSIAGNTKSPRKEQRKIGILI